MVDDEQVAGAGTPIAHTPGMSLSACLATAWKRSGQWRAVAATLLVAALWTGFSGVVIAPVLATFTLGPQLDRAQERAFWDYITASVAADSSMDTFIGQRYRCRTVGLLAVVFQDETFRSGENVGLSTIHLADLDLPESLEAVLRRSIADTEKRLLDKSWTVALSFGFPFVQQEGVFTIAEADRSSPVNKVVYSGYSVSFLRANSDSTMPSDAFDGMPLPTQFRLGGVVGNTISVAATLFACLLAGRTAIAWNRARRGRCPFCAYPNSGSRCPECGSESPAAASAQPATWWSAAMRRSKVARLTLLLVISFLLAAVSGFGCGFAQSRDSIAATVRRQIFGTMTNALRSDVWSAFAFRLNLVSSFDGRTRMIWDSADISLGGSGRRPADVIGNVTFGLPFRSHRTEVSIAMNSLRPVVALSVRDDSGVEVGQYSLPLRPVWPGLLANTACIFIVLALGSHLLAARRVRRQLCVKCGYKVKGCIERCPECGHALPAAASPKATGQIAAP